ncbi:MAG TPA: hypothetical protein VN961_18365, partial [Streptosporangiaceae bacterium]|nr:hypothetical protein [Streptosporangiaceae bacterium]
PLSGPGRAAGPRLPTIMPMMAGSLMKLQAPWDDAAGERGHRPPARVTVPRLTLEGTGNA